MIPTCKKKKKNVAFLSPKETPCTEFVTQSFFFFSNCASLQLFVFFSPLHKWRLAPVCCYGGFVLPFGKGLLDAFITSPPCRGSGHKCPIVVSTHNRAGCNARSQVTAYRTKTFLTCNMMLRNYCLYNTDRDPAVHALNVCICSRGEKRPNINELYYLNTKNETMKTMETQLHCSTHSARLQPIKL